MPDEYRGIREVCPDEVLVERLESAYYDLPDCVSFWDDLRREFSLSFSPSELSLFHNAEDEFQRMWKREMFSFIKECARKLQIVLLSNQIETRATHLRKSEDFSFFSHLFFSNEVGLKKPDEAIFYFVLREINEEAGKCLFIDDALKNIDAARKIGMKGYVFPNLKFALRQLRLFF